MEGRVVLSGSREKQEVDKENIISGSSRDLPFSL